MKSVSRVRKWRIHFEKVRSFHASVIAAAGVYIYTSETFVSVYQLGKNEKIGKNCSARYIYIHSAERKVISLSFQFQRYCYLTRAPGSSHLHDEFGRVARLYEVVRADALRIFMELWSRYIYSSSWFSTRANENNRSRVRDKIKYSSISASSRQYQNRICSSEQ